LARTFQLDSPGDRPVSEGADPGEGVGETLSRAVAVCELGHGLDAAGADRDSEPRRTCRTQFRILPRAMRLPHCVLARGELLRGSEGCSAAGVCLGLASTQWRRGAKSRKGIGGGVDLPCQGIGFEGDDSGKSPSGGGGSSRSAVPRRRFSSGTSPAERPQRAGAEQGWGQTADEVARVLDAFSRSPTPATRRISRSCLPDRTTAAQRSDKACVRYTR
jgi:hypothetical protein